MEDLNKLTFSEFPEPWRNDSRCLLPMLWIVMTWLYWATVVLFIVNLNLCWKWTLKILTDFALTNKVNCHPLALITFLCFGLHVSQCVPAPYAIALLEIIWHAEQGHIRKYTMRYSNASIVSKCHQNIRELINLYQTNRKNIILSSRAHHDINPDWCLWHLVAEY